MVKMSTFHRSLGSGRKYSRARIFQGSIALVNFSFCFSVFRISREFFQPEFRSFSSRDKIRYFTISVELRGNFQFSPLRLPRENYLEQKKLNDKIKHLRNLLLLIAYRSTTPLAVNFLSRATHLAHYVTGIFRSLS